MARSRKAARTHRNLECVNCSNPVDHYGTTEMAQEAREWIRCTPCTYALFRETQAENLVRAEKKKAAEQRKRDKRKEAK